MKTPVQLRDLVFFLDENLGGEKVASALRQSGLKVELHGSHFPRGTADDQWLPVVGNREWILLTQDTSIRRRKNEIEALLFYKVRAFFVPAKNLRGEEIGALIVSAAPKIHRTVKQHRPPIVALIQRSGGIDVIQGERRYERKGADIRQKTSS
ncbi:MAG: hypothetical protein E6Q97_20835 [Desulfurellales bacterium]|nr:MAG: hypothetical protein E6Q97_20835 [Desulfurellales bacterium]